MPKLTGRELEEAPQEAPAIDFIDALRASISQAHEARRVRGEDD